jgi:hypothetical protein
MRHRTLRSGLALLMALIATRALVGRHAPLQAQTHSTLRVATLFRV